MSWRMHIAVVDCATTHPTRSLPSSFYTNPLPKKTTNVAKNGNDVWTRWEDDEDKEVDRTAFNDFVANDFGLKEDYCLGRLPIPMDIGQPFYDNEETQKLFSHYNPRVIKKDDFKKIIDLLRKEVVNYYSELLLNRNHLHWQGILETKMELWEAPYVEPYNLDDDKKEIVRAYDLEYRIFDLVRLYKTIDWYRDTVIFYGW